VQADPFAMHWQVFTVPVPTAQIPEQHSVPVAQTMPMVLQHAFAVLHRPYPQQSVSTLHGPAGG
jgi:hypothetical protein